jgi:transposase-like protein
MGAKKLSDADKAQAVLDLLQGKGTMAEICNRYGISPTYLYKLRDRALEAVKVAVAGGEKRDISRERQLELELNRAKQLIGDQAMVIEILKKSR